MNRWKVTAANGRVYSVYANTVEERESRCDAAGIPEPRTAEPAGSFDYARNVVENGGGE